MDTIQNILNQALVYFSFIPLISFLASLVWQNKNEKPIAFIVLFTKAFYILATIAYAVLWMLLGFEPLQQKLATLYQSDHFVFAIQFYYDGVTATFSVVGAILFFLVSTFSKYYMHRDEGYKRFFNTILFFALGYNLIVFSGNFETLFLGWEIIGLASFLLVAFYRNRYLPVKNAFKTISNYRVSDVSLMLAMWMMHHLTHQNISFTQLGEARIAGVGHESMVLFIAGTIVLAALIKSAQLPFTSWLPRAMEGPTSSTAIFYGSLSVHIGVFLLLRTYPFWQDLFWVKTVVVVMGAATAIIATAIARVQPTVKTQIAYSSAAQIGIIFIEVALGLHVLALIHFAGNAFLRTYQLLVSPSVLNYLVHHQYFHHKPAEQKKLSGWQASLYMLAIKEWNLDALMYHYVWSPFKWIGRKFQWLHSMPGQLLVVLCILVVGFVFYKESLADWKAYTTVPSLALALVLSLAAFSSRGNAIKTWGLLIFAHVFILLGVNNNTSHANRTEFIMYAAGILIMFLLGLACLWKTQKTDKDISLNQYHGYVYEQRTTTFIFLIAAIGMLGFPVTTAFIGIDVLFTYIQHGQPVQIALLGLCFIFIELAALRIFIRIYLGPHKKLYHPVAFRSS